MATTRLLLVRHAHADWAPDEMRPLSSRGRRDAERLVEILLSEAPVAIYSSPYRRARETVEPLAERMRMAIQVMSVLRERSLGDAWEDDWEATIRPTWDDFSFAYPAGGETNAEAFERAARACRRLQERHAGQSIVVATHGNLLVLMLRTVDPSKGFEFWRRLSLPDVYRLELEGKGRFALRRLWTPPAD